MNKRTMLYGASAIFLVAFGVFANTLPNGFVYDDAKQILSNIWITDLRYLPDIFTHDVWGFWPEHGASGYYRPMMHILNLALNQTFGLLPWAYHFMNVLFHSVNSVLVFLLTFDLFRKEGKTSAFSLALISGLMFASHPIHCEAVAWAGGIPDLSYTFFLLLSFYLYQRSTEKGSSSPLLLSVSLLSFVLALLSKEPALILPFILILYESSERKDHHLKLQRYIPYIVIAVAYLAVRFAIIGGIKTSGEDSSVVSWLPDVFVLFATYLGKLLLPINLNVYYSYSSAGSFLAPSVLLGIVVTCIFITALIISFRKSRLVFTGLLFIAAPLLPALYIPAIGGTPFAERYLYLPSFGYVLLLSLVIYSITEQLRHHGFLLFVTAGIAIALFYSFGAIARNQVWENDFSLWYDTVQKSPASFIARNNLGRAYFTMRDVDSAIEQYQVALSLEPNHAEAHNNLGAAYATKNMTGEAEQHFLLALKLKPGYSDAHNNIGIFYGSQGQNDRAIYHFKSALKSRPDFGDAHHNLAVTYLAVGALDLAIKHFNSALEFEPDNVNTHLNLARAYEQKGLLIEARRHRLRAEVLKGGQAGQ